ncbi:MAG: ExeM/NucH family extracellular endonuclease, partial [Bifidobacteriaceae bacterium]|nr:ExeM/NucH family extracellular endonuclease [Bifidobacteriaceae bacterium]
MTSTNPRVTRSARRWAARAAASAAAVALVTIPALHPVAEAAVSPTAPVIINEVYGGGGNSGAVFTHDFVELYNTTSAPVSLDGWSLQYASAGGAAGFVTTNNAITVFDTSTSIAAEGYLLIQLAAGTNPDLDPLPTPDVVGATAVSGTAGRFALVQGTTPLGACEAATSCSLRAEVIDFVAWGPSAIDYAGSGPGPIASNATSVSRSDAHANTADNAADFTAGAPTPTNASGPQAPPPPPQAVEASIGEIQGTTAVPGAPLGTLVTVKGVVTASYPVGGLNGFTIQEPGSGGAIDLASWDGSQGVFVYAGTTAITYPAVGDYVEVVGTTADYSGLTQITLGSSGTVSQLADAVAAPQPVQAPWPTTAEQRETLESMLYQPSGTFTVTDTYSTNSYGTVGLAYGSTPLVQPTEVYPSSYPAGQAAIEADNAARQVILDDGSSMNFTSLANAATNTPAYISQTNPVRVGATVTFDDPVIIDYRNNAWTLNPTERVTGPGNTASPITVTNTRTAAPDAAKLGSADLKLASFNVLNYFPSTGATWAAGCTSYNSPATGTPVTVNSCNNNGPRGAWDAANLQRQQDKIVAAINALDASVVALMEIENSAVLGEPVDRGVATLVTALNAAAGPGTWAFVPSPANLPPLTEQDVITTAIIYRPDAVTSLGA